MTLESYLLPKLEKFHTDHLGRINIAKGSESKHQAWTGGYRHHLTQCFEIAEYLYHSVIKRNKHDSFEWPDVVYVLYFHDIEKIYKYVANSYDFSPNGIKICANKERYLFVDLKEKYDIEFTDKQKNALKYIHGEGNDYCEKRVMNELAAFCHCCDTISARIFYDDIILKGWNKW